MFQLYGHIGYQYKDTEKKYPFYIHIQANPKTTSMYDNTQPIYQLIFEFAIDQIPNKNPNYQEYWGWLKTGETQLSMIQPNYNIFKMCFPYALEDHISHGEGKAYKLTLVKSICLNKHNG